MKKFALFIAALASCLVMSAQDVKVKSRVELKGGKAAVTGYAELQADGGYVVETESGDIFYYSASEIKKVTVLEENAGQNVKVKKTKTLPDVSSDRSKTRGYMGILEAGLGLPTGITMTNGFRFSQHFYLGVGMGLNVDALEEIIAIPLYLHLRTEFTKRKVAPYFAVSLGTTYDIDEEIGPYLEGAFGIRTYCKKHGSMWFGLAGGYNLYMPALSLKIAYSF